MQRDRVWLFSVKRQALVLATVAALAIVPGLGSQIVPGFGSGVAQGAQCVYDPTTGGCAGPTTGGGGCAGTVCPSGAGAAMNTPQGNGQTVQTVNTPPQTALGSGGSSGSALGGVCILPATITMPVAAPGVGYPATGAYMLASATSGKVVVCLANGQLQFTGPAGAAIAVARNNISITVTLDKSGAGIVATSGFGG